MSNTEQHTTENAPMEKAFLFSYRAGRDDNPTSFMLVYGATVEEAKNKLVAEVTSWSFGDMGAKCKIYHVNCKTIL